MLKDFYRDYYVVWCVFVFSGWNKFSPWTSFGRWNVLLGFGQFSVAFAVRFGECKWLAFSLRTPKLPSHFVKVGPGSSHKWDYNEPLFPQLRNFYVRPFTSRAGYNSTKKNLEFVGEHWKGLFCPNLPGSAVQKPLHMGGTEQGGSEGNGLCEPLWRWLPWKIVLKSLHPPETNVSYEVGPDQL